MLIATTQARETLERLWISKVRQFGCGGVAYA
jgi:hypothetical protein